MRGRLQIALFLVAFSAIFAGSALAEVLGPFSVRAGETGLLTREQRLFGEDYDFLTFKGYEVTREMGEPMLPVTARSIYIPRGMAVKEVRVLRTRSVDLGGDYLITPAQQEVPLSFVGPVEPVRPNEAVYAMDTPYPASCVKAATSGSIAGRKILGVEIYPLQYVPAERRVVFNEEVEFEVELKPADREPRVPLETPNVRKMRNATVRDMVENPGDLFADFADGSGTLDPSAATEYLIIALDGHVDEYEALKEWKTRKGVPAAIVSTSDALASYTGRDDPEKLRNCIMDYYLNESTAWVLMTLSAPKAKIRGCYGRVGGSTDNEIPCDLYFMDMDGDWNLDGDGIWGETSDDVDLYPDVYVGRNMANTGVKCSTVVYKYLTYEGYYSLPTDYQLDFLFMAEYVDEYTDMSELKDRVDNESVPSRFDPILKLYQDDGTLTHEAAMDALNAGMGLINHAGHGNVTILSIGDGGTLNKNNMESLTNAPRYGIFYTLACLPAAFDDLVGCIAKSYVEADNGGGFFVGNSRNGYYSSGSPGFGTGDYYEREFWEAVFAAPNYTLGQAHAEAKIARIPYSGSTGTNRWTQFSMNLFADPEMQIWRDTPEVMTVSHPASLLPGNHTITVTVMDGGSPIDVSKVCLWKDDEVYQVEETDALGEAEFTFTVGDSGEILVTVSSEGFLPYMGSIEVGDPDASIGLDEGVRELSLRVTPNPLAGSASILYSLPGATASVEAAIEIYDVTGRLLKSIDLDAGAGAGSIRWDGRLGDGSVVRPGIYFMRLSTGSESSVKKFVVLK
jgi:hypothetical protein